MYRLSEHLETLANQLSAVEETLCEALTPEQKQNDVDITKLQGLDYIRQSLEDCALLSLLMSGSSETDGLHAEEIASRLKLESSRALVLPKTSESYSGLGDVQLFD